MLQATVRRNVITGKTVLVEAKYSSSGKPSLTTPQRLAQKELPARGLDYRVVTTTPGQIGSVARTAGSVAGGLAGSTLQSKSGKSGK